jgi:hypothetical protein
MRGTRSGLGRAIGRLGVLVTTALVGDLGRHAQANPVVCVFSGTVTSETGPAPVAVGAGFVGAMFYDDSAPDLYLGPDSDSVGRYEPSPLAIRVLVGDSAQFGIVDPNGFIQLIDDNTTLAPPFVQNVLAADVIAAADRIQILIASQTTLPAFPSGPITSNMLRGLSVDLGNASSFREIIIGHADNIDNPNNYRIFGNIDSFFIFAAVPEPSSSTLGIIALVVLAARRKRLGWLGRRKRTARHREW